MLTSSHVIKKGANELWLGTDREPQMFAGGTPKRLTVPKTSTEALRELLRELSMADGSEASLLRSCAVRSSR